VPVPEDVVRVNLNFAMEGGEIAVSTFHLKLAHEAGASVTWDEMTQQAADKVLDKWQSHCQGTAFRDLFSTSVSLQSIATYHLEAATGHALDKGIAVPPNGGGWSGTQGQSLPYECAMAVSLYAYAPGTFVAQRARKRGRFYLPPMAPQVMAGAGASSAGRIATTAVGAAAGAIGPFLNDVHQMSVGQDPLGIGQTWNLVVLSRAGVMTNVVQAARFGDVMDVQRRRRNQQSEVYTTVQITQD
jgi:hypothetical protein